MAKKRFRVTEGGFWDDFQVFLWSEEPFVRCYNLIFVTNFEWIIELNQNWAQFKDWIESVWDPCLPVLQKKCS